MFKIELLSKHHDRTAFDCGNDDLNRFLQQYANQHSKKGLSKTYVLVDDEQPQQILGFYAICANAIKQDLQGYPTALNIPSLLIGRLGVDNQAKGKGIATRLMMNLLERTKALSKNVGIAMITVDLKGYHLVKFYEYFGFKPLEPHSLTMYLKVNEITTIS